jgi:hypothetical protein
MHVAAHDERAISLGKIFIYINFIVFFSPHPFLAVMVLLTVVDANSLRVDQAQQGTEQQQHRDWTKKVRGHFVVLNFCTKNWENSDFSDWNCLQQKPQN